MTFRHRAGVRPYTSSWEFAESCVFVKQSPEPFHCGSPDLMACRQDFLTDAPINPGSTPSSEVTGLVCLVPKREITRAPEYILPVHLCRITVRTRRELPSKIFLRKGSTASPEIAPGNALAFQAGLSPVPRIFLGDFPTGLDRNYLSSAGLPFPVSPRV